MCVQDRDKKFAGDFKDLKLAVKAYWRELGENESTILLPKAPTIARIRDSWTKWKSMTRGQTQGAKSEFRTTTLGTKFAAEFMRLRVAFGKKKSAVAEREKRAKRASLIKQTRLRAQPTLGKMNLSRAQVGD